MNNLQLSRAKFFLLAEQFEQTSIKPGDTVGNTVQGFDFTVVKVYGNKLLVRHNKSKEKILTHINNMYLLPSAQKMLANSNKEIKEDHEVSMANNSLDSIIWAANEIKKQLGNQERNLPAWIQDHITNAENFITQAAKNFHDYNYDEMQ